jgi:hypothetical protein
VVRVGGSLNVAALFVTTSGPRSDLSGSAALVVGDTTVAGDLRGRVSRGTPDSSGRQRLDGTLTVVTADGKVEIRLTGYASPSADSPSTLALSGLFRASGVDSMLTSGSMRGSLGSTLALSFSA